MVGALRSLGLPITQEDLDAEGDGTIGRLHAARLLVRKGATFAGDAVGGDDAMDMLRRVCGWIASQMVRRPAFYSVISLLIVGGLTLIYANLEPRYRLADVRAWLDGRQTTEPTPRAPRPAETVTLAGVRRCTRAR